MEKKPRRKDKNDKARQTGRAALSGDSITHGNRVESDWDMNHVLGHGYQFILAGKIGLDNYKTCPKIVNRGISGDTIVKIYARSDTVCLTFNRLYSTF